MRALTSILSFVLAAALVAAIVVTLLLANTDELKADLERYLSETTGASVAIDGDVSWQLFAPFRLEVNGLRYDDGVNQTTVETLTLAVDLTDAWRDLRDWRVHALTLTDVALEQPDARTVLTSATLTDFELDEASPFRLVGTYAPTADTADAEPAPPTTFDVTGQLRLTPGTADSPDRLSVTDTSVSSNLGEGTCTLDATRISNPAETLVDEPADVAALLPVAGLRTVDFAADCHFDWLEFGTEVARDATLTAQNVAGRVSAALAVRQFLGGTATVEADVDLTTRPLRWQVLPELDGIDTERWATWAGRRVEWRAALNARGAVVMYGNTEAALAETATGSIDFDADAGEINVSRLKKQLEQLATFTGRRDELADQSDVWPYDTFRGDVRIDGRDVALRFALDHVSGEANGVYDYLADTADVRATVTIGEAAPDSPVRVSDMLQDTPLPARCRGVVDDLRCRFDNDAARNLLAGALQKDSDTGLRRTLEEKIDEEVPEEFRDAARELLDLFGRALERDEDE